MQELQNTVIRFSVKLGMIVNRSGLRKALNCSGVGSCNIRLLKVCCRDNCFSRMIKFLRD